MQRTSGWKSSVLGLVLATTCGGGCAGLRGPSQIRIPEATPWMAGELDALEACCPATLDYLVEVLEARCAQIAERGERAPEECR